MSQVPFVALPRGVEPIALVGGFGPITGLSAPAHGAPLGTVLLVPGFTGSKEDFLELLPMLAARGWNAISYDQRGQFQSLGPEDPAAYSLTDFASDAISIADQLRTAHATSVHLVGHSFGGLVTREAIRQVLTSDNGNTSRTGDSAAPEQPSDLFASLTLMASGPGRLPQDIRELMAPLIAALPMTTLETVWELMQAAEAANGVEPPPPAIHEFLHARFINNNAVALAAKAQILTDEPDTVDQLAALLPTNPLPIMVAYGEHDTRWTTTEQDDMARRLGARRFIWPVTAHSPAAEHPSWCAGALHAFFLDASRRDSRRLGESADAGLGIGDGGYTGGMELRSPIGLGLDAVGTARHALVRQLQAWGLDGRADDFALIASEMITNAVRYGKGPLEVVLKTSEDSIRIEVSDCVTDELPTPRVSADDEPGGRGLLLIEALASDWGVIVTSGVKTVWAELRL